MTPRRLVATGCSVAEDRLVEPSEHQLGEERRALRGGVPAGTIEEGGAVHVEPLGGWQADGVRDERRVRVVVGLVDPRSNLLERRVKLGTGSLERGP
jgi:hypothetical protein